jgi:ubiquinone/menaquinone biosynthesis C-methylase UbiE
VNVLRLALSLLREQRLAPDPRAIEAEHALAFAHPDWLAAYGREEYVALGLHESEALLCERHLRPGDRVLDVGCGTGREARGFAARGLRVTAVDACPGAIERAREGASGIRFEVAVLPDLAFPDASFDAVFLASDVYAGLPGRANRIAALERCRRLLRPSGLVILPVSFERRGLLARVAIDGPRRLLPGLGLPEPGDRFSAPGPSGTRLFRHVFADRGELALELEAAGLAVVDRVSGFHVARAPGDPRLERYRRPAGVAVESAGAELLLVELARGKAFKLNGTGRAILGLALEGLPAVDVAARLHESLGVGRERLEADASSLLAELARERLLEVVA